MASERLVQYNILQTEEYWRGDYWAKKLSRYHATRHRVPKALVECITRGVPHIPRPSEAACKTAFYFVREAEERGRVQDNLMESKIQVLIEAFWRCPETRKALEKELKIVERFFEKKTVAKIEEYKQQHGHHKKSGNHRAHKKTKGMPARAAG